MAALAHAQSQGQAVRIDKDEVYVYRNSGIVAASGSEPVMAGMISVSS